MKTAIPTAMMTVALLLSGCGGGSSNTTVAIPPPADTTAPSLQSSEPADGASPVSIVTNPSMTLSEALDASSVNLDSVILANERGVRVRGEVSYDTNNNSVTFSPLAPLAEGTAFTMTLDGVRDVAGNTAPTINASFRTFLAPLVQTIVDIDGVTVAQADTELDTNGLPLRTITRADAGNDGIWQSGDEPPRRYVEFTRNASGDVIAETRFGDAGTDAEWFTSDDTVTAYRTFEIGTNGLVSRDVQWRTGPDGLLLTDDDEPQSYRERLYTAFGEDRVAASFRTPGDDGVWFTADDDPDRRAFVYEYDVSGLRTLVTEILRGPDNIAETADDEIVDYVSTQRNESEMRIELVSYTGAGSDGVWYTADDEISNYQFSPFDSEGRQTSFIRGASPGMDGVWFNRDDEIRTPINRFTYDDTDPMQTVVTIIDYNDVGVDGQPLTDDDVISQIRVRRLLDKGLWAQQEVFSAAGIDGIWQTPDDEQSSLDVLIRDEALNLLNRRQFGAPGPDGQFGTSDDVLAGEFFYAPPR
ncbi:MAG: Ig-like domain-containing protein [Pseudomonadota bacterium]